MTHNRDTWGDAAKARSKTRLEYFKRYRALHGQRCVERDTPVGTSDSTGVIGEKMFLSLKGSSWLGERIDGFLHDRKVDVKTSNPVNHRNGKKKWKFWLKQKGEVDFFLLFCLNEDKSFNKLYVIPDRDIVVRNISVIVGKPSKYDLYLYNRPVC